ncbi:MAG: phosphate ABC transporter, permease protein PstA, partial [Ruminococcus sp.]|nr:phosphate ABC transporter, permease protein PstA [Ruminococcus sp.]
MNASLKGEMKKSRKVYITIMKCGMLFCTALVALLTLFMIAYVLIKGVPNISWELLSTKPSYI